MCQNKVLLAANFVIVGDVVSKDISKGLVGVSGLLKEVGRGGKFVELSVPSVSRFKVAD